MRSGDGWIRCARGHRHWGRYGAAGLLIVRRSDVLLQLRSHHTHHGNTWSIPGGAREADEPAELAALREATEEIGLHRDNVETMADFVDDHGGWSYTTVLAHLLHSAELTPNYESAQLEWVPAADVMSFRLHTGFAASWPAVLPLVWHVSATWPD